MSKIPVIIDCDPGHDDAIAIMLCLSRPEFDVKGVVTVAGNQVLDKTTRNARRVLEFLNRRDVPVIKGGNRPILQDCAPAAAHGKSGMDGPDLPEPVAPLMDINPIEFYKKVLEESDQPVVLVPIGPLTNIAILIHTHPELIEKIACLNIMGGGTYSVQGKYANISPQAEFNIWHDAYAAEMVFASGIPINMFGLDVTHYGGASDEDISKIRENGGKVGGLVAELLDFYSIHYRANGMKLTPVHDACPIAYMIDPTLFKGEMHQVRVELNGGVNFGATSIDMRGDHFAKNERLRFEDPSKQNVNVILTVDRYKMLDLILEACKTYDI